ncbi:hypothetical protein [Saccharothrix sp. HUAS TT1]|uniref:hypothetical protein n=1 Tax=unclassified Saccharothrix TaxID=2593673 RepID=UPI00345BECD1
MDSHWVHGRPGYRCRHGYTSAHTRPADAPKRLYWREDCLLERLAALPEFADLVGAGKDGLAERLRAQGQLVQCDAAVVALVEGPPLPVRRGRRLV